MVELSWLDAIRRSFERHGFCSIETPAVEELDVLLAKGEEADKEIFTLTRLGASAGAVEDRARLGLHYDLTVPFARYVAQHFSELIFPFRRYQIQKVWRGERPQQGRYREFCQCDIDVVNPERLPLGLDAEMALVVFDALDPLDVGPFTLHISNRKVLEGFFQGLGVRETTIASRIVDKQEKIGTDGVAALLRERLELPPPAIDRARALSAVVTPDVRTAIGELEALGVDSPLLEQGVAELRVVMETLESARPGRTVVDFSIARGFDYYTGTVYEGRHHEYPEIGSVCSGGRYDDLAGGFIRHRLPGVGISIGLSRLFGKLVAEGRIHGGRQTSADVLVASMREEDRPMVQGIGESLRARAVNVEVYYEPTNLRKQLRYASRKGIRWVWLPGFGRDGCDQVRDMASAQQTDVDPETWTPRAA